MRLRPAVAGLRRRYSSKGEICGQIPCVSQSRPKANRRRYEQQQLGNPALYELTTRADRILDVPSAVRRAQDSQGRSREPYGSHVESPVVRFDRVAKTPGCRATSRTRRKIALSYFWKFFWLAAKCILYFVKHLCQRRARTFIANDAFPFRITA